MPRILGLVGKFGKLRRLGLVHIEYRGQGLSMLQQASDISHASLDFELPSKKLDDVKSSKRLTLKAYADLTRAYA